MTSDNIIQVVFSKTGVPIRLTYKQWSHIVESHDYMAGCIDILLETLAEPDFICRGWTDELVAIKHYEKTVITKKDAVVAYKKIGDDGFVITVWLTSKSNKILKRGIIWQRAF